MPHSELKSLTYIKKNQFKRCKKKKSLFSLSEQNQIWREKTISGDEYRKAKFDTFRETLTFKYVETIGRGRFTRILRVSNEDSEEGYAMKIVLKDDAVLKEKQWKTLHHGNILSLIDTEDCPVFSLTWFLSPVVDFTLYDVLKEPCLCAKKCKAFELAIPWVKGITSALNYIHKKELCFLNVKLTNVMITKNDSVKIFGFSRLRKIGDVTTGYDVPDEYRPPESYSTHGDKLPVEGRAFDLWCLGILTSEIFTGMYLARKVPDKVRCWRDVIYPIIFKILQKDKFNRRCRSAFPRCNINEKTVKLIRKFSRGCLRISPKLRPSAGALLHHRLFEETGLLLEIDKIWKKNLKPEDMRQNVFNLILPLENMVPNSHDESIQPDIQQIISDDVDNEESNTSQLENATSKSEEEDDSVKQALHSENVEEDASVEQTLHAENDEEAVAVEQALNSEDVEENVSVEQTLNSEIDEKNIEVEQNFQKIFAKSPQVGKIYPFKVSSLVKMECSNGLSKNLSLFLMQEMFSRTVIGQCQQHLNCRALHTETVVKSMKNITESNRKSRCEEKIPEKRQCSLRQEQIALAIKLHRNFFIFGYE